MSDDGALVFRSGRLSLEWVERANVIVLEHKDSNGNGLVIEPPPGLKFELEPFTLWCCEFLGMLMADQPTFKVESIGEDFKDGSFVVVLAGPLELLPMPGVLTPVPEAVG